MEVAEQVGLYYNAKQREAMVVNARDQTHIWGRGTGKSDGTVAPRLEENIFTMEQSLGIIVGATYQQILTRELPAIVKGWARMGYRMGVHYFIKDKAPDRWGWKKPHFMPFNTEYFIHWFNGSGIVMVSLDRPNSANGISADYLVGIEAKFLKQQRYHEEVIPILRGNREHFGHLWNYRSKHLTSDMPIHESGYWLLEKEHDMRPDVVRAIKQWHRLKTSLEMKMASPALSPASMATYMSEYRTCEFHLNSLRKRTSFYSEANAWDNIKVLGREYVEDMQRTLPEPLFRSSILNERVVRPEGGFYGDLTEEHLYLAPNNSYLDEVGTDMEKAEARDCRQDAMLVPTLPLRIGPDAGDKFNCIVVGQLHDHDINVENQFYVGKGKKLRDVVHEVCDYYAPHPCREVIAYYDHTFFFEDAVRSITYIDEICREFTKRGWKVKKVYIGQARKGETKYVFWSRLLRGIDPRLPRFRMNKQNCQPLWLSMIMAGTKPTHEGFKKNKDPERSSPRQEETTHLSDACDTLVIGIIEGGRIASSSSSTGAVYA